ncbi:DNA oxidative demethylase ALKBH2 [Bombina bombina]|uniref:DNA oxidative demethylase ALKBH2 n=1 Tax=Bombina bombina TaxID=8345 RepID=UPI00235A8E17|nr:DNA oxidative demethylase ALKBH2 [Bombina bombina]XP_053558103.1 DNA oxidative demethylase ALKBH2 [Bombina bombina]
MDKFVIKKNGNKNRKRLQEECKETLDIDIQEKTSLTKKSKSEELSPCLQAYNYIWKKIQAESLNCDYTLLFSKAEADGIFKQLEKEIIYFSGDLSRVQVYGKWHNVPRKQVSYGDDGLTYTFSGITLSPKPWIPILNSIRERVKLATGHTFNFVLINRYKDGSDHIGEHRDDEKELVPQSPIASVSFGACRDFVFRHRDARCKNPMLQLEPVKLELAHGSLLMMNFPTNVYWYHSLPVRKKVLAPRINLTFRKIILQDAR